MDTFTNRFKHITTGMLPDGLFETLTPEQIMKAFQEVPRYDIAVTEDVPMSKERLVNDFVDLHVAIEDVRSQIDDLTMKMNSLQTTKHQVFSQLLFEMEPGEAHVGANPSFVVVRTDGSTLKIYNLT